MVSMDELAETTHEASKVTNTGVDFPYYPLQTSATVSLLADVDDESFQDFHSEGLDV